MEHSPQTINLLRWLGTVTGVAGAALLALNIGISRYGFVALLLSALLYSYTSWRDRDYPLLSLQSTFIGINLLGIWRWFVV